MTELTSLPLAPSVSIREAFYSVQGEGARAGCASLFLRFAGCNLNCPWCDTDWLHGDKVPVTDAGLGLLMERVLDRKPWYARIGGQPLEVVLTGGEPTVAPAFDAVVRYLRMHGARVCVETNGTHWRESLQDCFVTISPKEWYQPGAELDSRVAALCTELKVVVTAETTLGDLDVLRMKTPLARHLFVQPLFEQRAAWARALAIVQQEPIWRLSLQTHKWLGAR